MLSSAEEHKERLKTDTLQRLHTTTNLAELIEAAHTGIAPTLRDGELRAEAQRLRSYYMDKYHGGVAGAREAVTPVTTQVEAGYQGFRSAKKGNFSFR